MQKEEEYEWTKFTSEIIKEALAVFLEFVRRTEKPTATYNVSKGKVKWTFDNESEFFAEYRKECDSALMFCTWGLSGPTFFFSYRNTFGVPSCDVHVALANRAEIEGVFSVFESGRVSSTIPRPKPPSQPWESRVRVFVGHGQDPSWKALRDHLQDKQKLPVESYEGDPRAGSTISDVLTSMLGKATFAILVLTGESVDREGKLHARENVIHELGLFQGKLGFNRAIALVEEGVTEFSNLHGVQQLRFSKGAIDVTFGDVLAVIRKE